MSQEIPIPLAINGLNKLDSGVDLIGQSPNMVNAFIEGTQIRKRLGYSTFGTGLPLTGVGQELIRYVDNLGKSHLIALTSTNAYRYDTSTGAWDNITPLSGSFSAGTRWSWDLKYDSSTFTKNGGVALLISNGTDALYFFEGSMTAPDDKFQDLTFSDWSSFKSSSEICEFYNHLFALNYTDTTAVVKGLAFANLNSAVVWETGTSGLFMFSGLRGKILRGTRLGGLLAVYADDSIANIQYVGGEAIFFPMTVIDSIGLFTSRGICELETANLILGSNYKIYLYYGGRQLEEVGQAIQNSLYGYLDVSKKDKVTCAVDEVNKRAYIFIPQGADTYSKYYYCLNYKKTPAIWEYGKFADDVCGLSIFDNVADWYCNDSQFSGIYCDERTFYCDAAVTRSGFKQICFLTSNGYIYKMDDITGTDDSEDIEFVYETPDISVDKSKHYGRWTWFCFQVMSRLPNATCEVYYSTDSGNNWNAINNEEGTSTTISIADGVASSWDEVRLPIDVVSRTIRFKIYQNSDKDIRLRNDMFVTGELKANR